MYSLEYTRTAADADASISVSGTTYSLPAGKMKGTLLIPVGEENVTGFSVSSKNEGITLTKVMVYTNNIVGLPVTLWTGDETPGNGIASDEGFPAAGYRPIVARIPLSEDQLDLFVPGAVLQCYFDDNTNVDAAELLWMGTLQLFYRWDNVGEFDENTHCLTNVVTLSMCDEIRENKNEIIFEKNWSDNLDFRLNRIELKPVISSETEDFSNLLWCHSAEGGEDCYMGYGKIKIGIPASLKSGDKIQITYSGATEGAYLEGVAGDADDKNSPRIFEQKTINSDATTVDIQIDDTMCSALLALRNTERKGGIIPLTISGQGLSVHKIQLVRGTEE